MLKIKTLAIALFASLIAFSAMAQSISMGLTGSVMSFEADGNEKMKSSGNKTNRSEDGVVPFLSVFVEFTTDMGTTIGLDVIPYSQKLGDGSNSVPDVDVDDLTDTAGTNKVDVNASGAAMVYLEQAIEDVPVASDFGTPYIKVAYSQISLETDDSSATGSEYGDNDINAVHFGLGMRGDLDTGGFWKAEFLYGDYDGATFTGTADADSVSNVITLEDMTTMQFRVSLGNSF